MKDLISCFFNYDHTWLNLQLRIITFHGKFNTNLFYKISISWLWKSCKKVVMRGLSIMQNIIDIIWHFVMFYLEKHSKDMLNCFWEYSVYEKICNCYLNFLGKLTKMHNLVVISFTISNHILLTMFSSTVGMVYFSLQK